MRPNREFLFKHPAHLIAFGFGAGLMPKAPGTWGTLVGIPFYFLALRIGGTPAVLACAMVLFGIGIWASSITGRALGVADHGGVVIDEIAAFVLVLALRQRDGYGSQPRSCCFAFSISSSPGRLVTSTVRLRVVSV